MCVADACPFRCDSCYSKSCECEWIDARGVGRQAGTRKATTRPHVKLSWPHLAGGGRTQDSWLRLCQQPPARAGGEDGVPQARNRASPHQRPAQHPHSHLASPSPPLSLVNPQHSNCPLLLPNIATFGSHRIIIFFFRFSRFTSQRWLNMVEICCPCIELLQPKLKPIHPVSQGAKEVYAMPINPSQIV